MSFLLRFAPGRAVFVQVAAAFALGVAIATPVSAAPSAADIESAVATLPPGVSPLVASVTRDFYRRRNWAPAWTTGAAKSLEAALGDALDQGLDPAWYACDDASRVADRGGAPGNARQDAAADACRTAAFARLAYDLRDGRIPAGALDGEAWRTHPLRGDDPVADLDAAVAGGDVRGFLASLQPDSVLYRRLQDTLRDLRRREAEGGWPAVPEGPKIEPGATDPRLALLRRRLVLSGDLSSDAPASEPDTLDPALVDAIRAFQSRHGLDADGVPGPRTIAAMNVRVGDRIDQVRATLERCRQYLHDLPERFVMVNAAAFRVVYFDGGRAVWKSRIIVGKPATETPMFRATIRSILLNPTWTVPHSIVRNELLPDLRRDPNHLVKMRIHEVDGRYVQEPGAHNALGRIKFEMPNPHSVYLHDTPSRALFERATRTFSHGCVRVQNPLELAALLLDDPAWSRDSLQRGIDEGRTTRIPLRRPVPVLVLYWSVTVDDDGRADFHPDVYGRDAQVLRDLR